MWKTLGNKVSYWCEWEFVHRRNTSWKFIKSQNLIFEKDRRSYLVSTTLQSEPSVLRWGSPDTAMRLSGATHSQFLMEMGLEHSDSDLLSGLVSELLVIMHSILIVKIYEKFLCSCFYLLTWDCRGWMDFVTWVDDNQVYISFRALTF